MKGGEHLRIEDIKKLEKLTVTPEQWKDIRHSDCVKSISLQGKERDKTDYKVIFNDRSSVIIYI